MATKNFKSGSAYKKWLAYGHASGKFAKTPGHQKVKIKGKSKKVKHAEGGHRSKYQLGNGGLPNWLYKARGKAMKKKMQAGGMYTDNTVASAGQGVPGSTANIVFQESDPRLQEQRLAALTAEQERLQELSATTEQEVKQMEVEGQEDIKKAELKSQQQFAAGETLTKSGLKATQKGLKIAGFEAPVGRGIKGISVTDKTGNIVGGSGAKQGIGAAIKAYKAQRATNKAIKTGKLLQSSAGTAAGAGWKALGAGAKGNIIGLAANLAGAGFKKWGGDDDPTKLTTGEWTGELLSGAGTGIGVASTLGTIGSAVGMGAMAGTAGMPLLGTAIGAVAGLGYGTWKALAGRAKARKAKEQYEAEVKEKVGKYNKKLRTGFGSQLARVRAGELAQKTYSGYDLGRNVVAQLGGMRMGMPRYGYAA